MKFKSLFFLFIIVPLQAMSPTKVKHYRQKYAAPSHIRKQLDTVCDSEFPPHVQTTQIGNLFIKRDDVTRLTGMELIRTAAQDHSCHNVTVPNKHRYTRPNGVSFIVAEEIIPKDPQLFTLELIKEVYQVAKITGYNDLNSGNIKVTHEGKIAFIDTDDYGFQKPFKSHNEKLDLLWNMRQLPMNDEAEAYIAKKFAAKEASISAKRKKLSPVKKNFWA